uniref:Uncharacterized protein n=1 Tax=Parascaris univalens TaxID=6257 RepID=A0A915BZP8_PARUN
MKVRWRKGVERNQATRKVSGHYMRAQPVTTIGSYYKVLPVGETSKRGPKENTKAPPKMCRHKKLKNEQLRKAQEIVRCTDMLNAELSRLKVIGVGEDRDGQSERISYQQQR